ncbi:uncharacterized protein LOC126770906 [Nymphalis io]|uniref:uncharacterized protein LOC126770906 n=1 Tax=Inachis io TaxID=171585 RepID=UPI00216A1492|nr:uncharacterized protein LOC126770906 [Nymphalis io]
MTSFDDLIKKVQSIHDLIIAKIDCANQKHSKDELEFSKKLYETKRWFVRISWKNKKRFVLNLIDEVHSIFTLSLLLKSIWNSRPKDAILSISEHKTWSSYDQVPLDHDRTVLVSKIQDDIMSNRKWFRSLESTQQCLVLAELLSVAGGPIMWEVLKSAEKIYEQSLQLHLDNLIECVVVNEPSLEKKTINIEAPKKEQTPRRKISANQILESSTYTLISGQVQKELDTNLALWAATIKTLKDNLKLEESEMTFMDGTKKRIWKVNRSKPEIVESVDFVQLLPSAVSKRILMYLPLTQLSDCARVNKYWAYLVDELRAEFIARQKIDTELEKLRENMLRHDENLGLVSKFAELDIKSGHAKTRDTNKPYPYSLVLEMNKAKQRRIAKPSFRNMTDLNNRLYVRGAADKNIRKWCTNICRINKNSKGPERSFET